MPLFLKSPLEASRSKASASFTSLPPAALSICSKSARVGSLLEFLPIVSRINISSSVKYPIFPPPRRPGWSGVRWFLFVSPV
nr:MAG TPA: hypothetical protein [Caudoviricetes sp.]